MPHELEPRFIYVHSILVADTPPAPGTSLACEARSGLLEYRLLPTHGQLLDSSQRPKGRLMISG